MQFELPVPGRGYGLPVPSGRWQDRWTRAARPTGYQELRKFEYFLASSLRPGSKTRPQARLAPTGAGTDTDQDARRRMEASRVAELLLQHELASPRGFARLRPMTSAGVQEYLRVEQHWRREPKCCFEQGQWKVKNAKPKWERERAILEQAQRLGARSIDEILREQRDDAMRDRLWLAYQSLSTNGRFSLDPERRPGIPWESMRKACAAMGSVTEVQYGLLAPGVLPEVLHSDLKQWEREKRIQAIEDRQANLPTRYCLTMREAEAMIREGLMAGEEWDQTAHKRTDQRHHDEAAADAMIMLALAADEMGLAVVRVIPESSLLHQGMKPPVPDFVLILGDRHGAELAVEVEIIGLGGHYRSASFKESQETGRLRLQYRPPYLPDGGYFV